MGERDGFRKPLGPAPVAETTPQRDRCLSALAKLEIREEIRPKVLKANARRLLGI
jgi:hypothetical protein